jgi:hypothetical protein
VSEDFPSAASSDGTLVIRFQDAAVARSVKVACVIDQTDFGDVIGVEILGFRRQLSGGVVEFPRASSGVRWSYDDEADAFYVQLMQGRSHFQTSVAGKAGLDAAQRVVLLEVPVLPAAHRKLPQLHSAGQACVPSGWPRWSGRGAAWR